MGPPVWPAKSTMARLQSSGSDAMNPSEPLTPPIVARAKVATITWL